MHECKPIFDDSYAGRKWCVYCETCKCVIGACISEEEAVRVGENHTAWQNAKQIWEAKFTSPGR